MVTEGSKASARLHLRQRRHGLDPAGRAAEAAACAAAAIALAQRLHPPAVASYAAMPDEVDLAELHRWCWSNRVPLLLPRVACPGGLTWHQIAAETDLAPGAYGIREPLDRLPAVAPRPGTLLFVPGLGFTADGHRLGQGGGFYDRILGERSWIAIGVAFDCQLVQRLPLDAHDQPVAGLIVAGRLVRDPIRPDDRTS